MNRLSALFTALSNLGFTKEAFIPEALKWISRDRHFKDVDLIQFAEDNAADLDTINKIAEGNYVKLGLGTEGVAYAIGKDHQKVLKITFSQPEHLSHDEDVKRALEALSSGKSYANHEAAVYDSGQFVVTYSGGFHYEPIKGIWWKIIELFNTAELDPIEVNVLIETIWARFENTVEDIFDGSDDAQRNAMAIELASDIRNSKSQYERYVVSDLDKILSPGWLEDFIDGMIYMISVRKKKDFTPHNLGIRDSTKRLVWFDS